MYTVNSVGQHILGFATFFTSELEKIKE